MNSKSTKAYLIKEIKDLENKLARAESKALTTIFNGVQNRDMYGRFVSSNTKKKIIKKKPNIVEVIRHIRVRDMTDYLSSTGGMTIVFKLNYNDSSIRTLFSVCSPSDNFDKKIGIQVAKKEGYEFFFDMSKGFKEGSSSLVEEFISNFYDEKPFSDSANKLVHNVLENMF
jgi:hypothetical protein